MTALSTTVGLVPNWYPPTRENYDLIISVWQWFPVAASLQWLISWYGMGKTSVASRLNLPGRVGWMTMEAPGFLSLLYMMNTLSAQHGLTDLPWQNKVLAGLFVIHYSYRAILFPLIQPSMSPLHVLIWLFGLLFQVVNGTCIGAWLAAYGPTTREAWAAQLSPFPTLQFASGIALFYVGLAANYFHDDELREIRRREMARQARLAAQGKGKAKGGAAEKHYEIPQAGLFKIMLYPHYFVEWVEWLGFWIAAGWSSAPARCFLVNEIAAMLPRAVNGKQWYIEKFGADKIKKKWAVIPGVW
ncbi:3-oxo-5-alpha-steroid 4-dehydrogenase-domain-containing protein [Lasiosphaeria ovina]|uniref:3-oxo-5-alpha-steroid 4-dehydrogenase-domain-containing protein n=1 Tax=Lasiosphaeria ovina TaxID=92902 RepID=A0AAE0MYI0_9PEZI|nr:3-oxo-5-alpha-steroid 4-dehydrogenase-domain-containing protein [Lasiosphaeria ovina]